MQQAMLSLIVPIYNEECLIDELTERTISTLQTITPEYELLFINDGSTDGSLKKLLENQKRYPGIKVVELSKNFGHQAAYTAGLELSRGKWVAMMDGDLQDPPELLRNMYTMLTRDEYDIVSGKRLGRRGNAHRNFLNNLFHKLFTRMTALSHTEDAGNFSMMNRDAVQALLSMKEHIRYLPGLRSFIGFRQGFVEYIREERSAGKTKMNMGKLLLLGTDAIFSFSKFPIRLCMILGLLGTTVFMLAGIYVLIAKIFGFAVLGWSSTILSIYFLGSIQLIFLGVLGEYIFRIYKETQRRPVYLIRKIYDENDQHDG